VTEARLRELLTKAGVDLERPRAADVETTWGVWRRFAAKPGKRALRARWGFHGDRLFRVGLELAELRCTFAFEPAQGLRPVEDGDRLCETKPGTFFDQLPELPGFAAVRGRTPASLEIAYSDV
jgi:hypothetical protein